MKKRSPEYTAWVHMITRCDPKNSSTFPRYAGRRVRVCDRWTASFSNFLEDMGVRPSGSHSLDRIDNDGNYEPGNCRWATTAQQARNKSNNRILSAHGISKCVQDWADDIGVNQGTIMHRIATGWTEEDAVSLPAGSRGLGRRRSVNLTVNGESLSIQEWADRSGLNRSTIEMRLMKGMCHTDAVLTPLNTTRSGAGLARHAGTGSGGVDRAVVAHAQLPQEVPES